MSGKTLLPARAIKRRPAATIQRSAAAASGAAPSPARKLQERLGNRASQTVIARSIVSPAKDASAAPVPVGVTTAPAVQLAQAAPQAAKVSKPHEPAELEAEETARKVMRMHEPPAPKPTAQKETAKGTLQRAEAAVSPAPATPTSSPVNIAGGAPLPAALRGHMEPRFGANFGNVRVHTGESAAQQSADLNAHAFTVGDHVFFGRDKFQPQSAGGRELIAHELTHTIQQGAVVQRSADTTVTQRAPASVQRLGGPRDYFAEKANLIPGFRLFTIILGVNPINMESVAPSAANILRGLLELIPITGALLAQALDSYGIFAKVGAWVEGQIRSLGMVGSSFRRAVDEFISSLGLGDLNPFAFGSLWERAKRIFTDPIDRLIAFGKALAKDIIGFIREAILLPLAKLAENTRGYDLLKAVLGQDPVTGQEVPRTPETLIGGFMKFIGQEEVWENIKKANAIPRAWAWFQGALAGLMGFVRQIPTLFMNTLKSLEIVDLILPLKAFVKVASAFGGFALQFVIWAGKAVWSLLELIFEVVSPGTLVYLKKTGAALMSILKNPLPFVGNLVRAAKLGFQNFADNFGSHLKAGLIDWLTGSLEGVYIPKALSLVELGKFAISVLGVSWAQIRGKIVKVLGPNGEMIMKGLETGFDIVVALVNGGPAAAWELIKEKLTDLKDQVVSGIIGFVTDTIVKKAIPKLIAMFIPGAGFISAIISIYDTIMVFVEKISKIIQVVTAFIDSMVAIAGGNIAAAAKRVENILGNLLSLAISFLAGFLGLGKVTDKIKEVIQKVRATVDKAIDAAIAWVVDKAKKLFARLFGKKDGEEGPKDHKAIAKEVAGELKKVGKGHGDPKQLRKEKEEQAKALEESYTAQLEQGVKLKINLAPDKGESKIHFDVIIAPNDTVEPGDIDTDTLETIKAYVADKLFAIAAIVELGMDEPTARKGLQSAADQGKLHVLKPRGARDPEKEPLYCFDASKVISGRYGGKRTDYGYVNPDKRSKIGLTILSKGLENSPPPGKLFDPDWHENMGRYKSMRSGTTNLKFKQVILGHDDDKAGASDHWNEVGHTQTKDQNRVWNQDTSHYWGPEEGSESSGSGSSSDLYRAPALGRGSNSMWL